MWVEALQQDGAGWVTRTWLPRSSHVGIRDHIPVLFYDVFFVRFFFYKGAEEEKVYKWDDCTPGIRLLLQSDCGTTGRSAKTMQTKCSVNVQQREDVKTIKKD